MCRPVKNKELPAALRRIQWISFTDGSFKSRLQSLLQALDTDLEWVQSHTRLLVRAREWAAKERDGSFLLRGKDLQDAIKWLAQTPTIKEPKAAALQEEYIRASQQWEADEIQRLKELPETPDYDLVLDGATGGDSDFTILGLFAAPQLELFRDPFRCSVFYPEKVGPEEVGRILAYVHLDTIADKVVREAAQRLDLPSGVEVKVGSEKPHISLPWQTMIDVTPEVPGLVFETPRASMQIWEDKQSVELRFRPSPNVAGVACRGWVHFWLEGVILADVPIVVFLVDKHVPDIFREKLSEANAKPYRRVFPSYCRDDAKIVERLEAYALSLGDEYMRDLTKLRAGQRWAEELDGFIRRADVFQLFWSRKAAASDYVKKEWQRGLREREARPDPFFVRPVYWSKKPARIPRELKPLQFVRVPLGAG